MSINEFNEIFFKLDKNTFESEKTVNISIPFEGKDKENFYLKGVVPGQIIKSDHINWILSELGVKFNNHIRKYNKLIDKLNNRFISLIESLNILVRAINNMENEYNKVIDTKIKALESNMEIKIKNEKEDLIDRISLVKNENTMVKNIVLNLDTKYNELITRVDKHEACTEALMTDVKYIEPIIRTESIEEKKLETIPIDGLNQFTLLNIGNLSIKEKLKYLFTTKEYEYDYKIHGNEHIFYKKLYNTIFMGVIFNNGSFLLLKNKGIYNLDDNDIAQINSDDGDFVDFPYSEEAFFKYSFLEYYNSSFVVVHKSITEKFGKIKEIFLFRPTISEIKTTGTDSLKKIIEEWKKSH